MKILYVGVSLLEKTDCKGMEENTTNYVVVSSFDKKNNEIEVYFHI